jgi:6-bladed beta-propeller
MLSSAVLAGAAVLSAWTAGFEPAAAVKTITARAVVFEPDPSDASVLGRPVFITFDADAVYVVDAEDCAIKVFSKTGAFKGSIGRRGSGPGEFCCPSGLAVLADRLLVADALNKRVQVLDRAGHPLSAFPVPFIPDKVHAASTNRIFVTHLASGRRGPEKTVHVFDGKGKPVGEGLDSLASCDPVFDVFRNMTISGLGDAGLLCVVHKCGSRRIAEVDDAGGLAGTIPIDDAVTGQSISLPLRGLRKDLVGYWWTGWVDASGFFLTVPERVNGSDLGAGRKAWVLDTDGRVRHTVSFPETLALVAVDGDRVFAVNGNGEFRIYRISP